MIFEYVADDVQVLDENIFTVFLRYCDFLKIRIKLIDVAGIYLYVYFTNL